MPQLSLSHPWALVLLGVLPLVAGLGLAALRRRRHDLALFGVGPAFLPPPAAPAPWLRRALAGLGLALLALGAAGPRWGRDAGEPVAPGRDLVLVLDVSRSMRAEQPSRLERARAGLADLIVSLRERGGPRVGLVLFAARPVVACPLTHDYDHLLGLVQQLDPARRPPQTAPAEGDPSGTRLGAALRAALDLHDPAQAGYQDILLLSDGDDPADDGDWRLPAAECRARQVAVFTVGVGDPDADHPIPLGNGGFQEYEGRRVLTRLREAPLRDLAALTGGVYLPARTGDLPLGRAFRAVLDGRPAREDLADLLPRPRPRQVWFLAVSLVLLCASLLPGVGFRSVPRTGRPGQGTAP